MCVSDTCLDCREPEIQPAEPREQASAEAMSRPASARLQRDSQQGASASMALEDVAKAKEAMGQELSLLRSELIAAQSARATAESESEELRTALATEKNRAFKAEVDVSELRTQLSTMDELQSELQRYKVQAEQAAGKKGAGGGGLWGYISGA